MLLFRQIAPGKHERPKGHLLKQFYFDAQALKKKFETFNMVHISRDLNTRADELANKAMDTKSSHVSIYA
jgi:ribonuclease HI